MPNKSISMTFCLITILFLAVNALGGPGAAVVLGVDEDAGMLLDPRQAEAGPDSNIYVLDAGDSTIKVYAPDGEYLRKIAGPGEGPGEFQRVDGATFGFGPDGNLFFTEFLGGHRWLTRMKLSGDLIGEVMPRLEVTFGTERASALTDGSFLIHLSYGFKSQAVDDYFLYENTQALVRVAADGRVMSEITSASYGRAISVSNNGGTYSLPYTPVFAWTALGDSAVAYADGMSRIFKIQDLDGKPIREIRTDLPGPEKVTGDELDAWRSTAKERLMAHDRSWYESFGRVIEKYRESRYDRTSLVGLSTTTDGDFLVEGRSDEATGKRHFWLLDQEGRMLANVLIHASNLRISAQMVLYLAPDEEGNTLVHCFARTGTDVDDLLQVDRIVGLD